MAHGFRNLGKESTFATRKQLAWHKLGKVVDAMTSEEAIVLGGMDFDVSLAPIYAGVEIERDIEVIKRSEVAIKEKIDGDSRFRIGRELPANFATYRTDTKDVFGVVGKRYTPIQNTDAFAFFDSIIGEGHAKYETVGALGNGEKIFITAKLPNKLIVNKEDIDKYLLLTMAHDGSGAVQAMFTPIRVVCNNTLSCALSSASNKVSIRHTKNALDRLKIAQQVLGIAERQTTSLEEVFTAFSKHQMTDEHMETYFKGALNLTPMEDGKLSSRAENILNDVLQYHEIGVGQEGIRGTAWGAYNAITGYQQNVQNYRDDALAFDSINSKNVANVRQRAFNNLLLLV